MIKQIECRGTPCQIGITHGSQAAPEIARCIEFYAALFQKTSKRSWPEVLETAKLFDAEIKAQWPRFHEEMRGIAEGAKSDLLDIIALNVRTEIAFGLFSDGCTSLSWRTPSHEFLGQNWDWQTSQSPNLIALTIHQPSLPTIKILTEAGIIGKISLNSQGVGLCFNAIRATGVSMTRMPVHLGLRTVLESFSTAQAVNVLKEVGMASSAHILIVDSTGDAVGLEFTNSSFATAPELNNKIIHSNHLLAQHDGVVEPPWLEDSPQRIVRMNELTEKVGDDPSWTDFSAVFEDGGGFPASICRTEEGGSTFATLFNIVMDLKARRAVAKMGRPVEPTETIEFRFE
ncbi:acyl-coenzyme A:6-aminopenicillanic acid acyl-transferase-domain-containing protein [Amylocarpus encephaloides]|uniref:Acyl-coenzyme A:6-aminopenicillanic acid acyl-transferase-domain-containing protein n=1 Tax=Amylocarpus encephaloides TaxID=45428 RepID=A0A9P8BZD7_9HELO|nr:acyl-coenzyme A:6-aminopenicillanic acid acyl-transferase-domain-containing protein [Amylocarpus encephaloides]